MCLIDVKTIITTLSKIQFYVEGTNNTLVGNRFKGAAVAQFQMDRIINTPIYWVSNCPRISKQ